MTRRFRPVLALTAGILAVSACAASESAETPGSLAVRTLGVGDLRTLRLPLDPYAAFSVSPTQIREADLMLFDRCMKRFGFPAAPAAAMSSGQTRAGPVTGYERRYGLADEAAAATDGYHLPAGSVPSQNRETALQESLSDDYLAVAGGTAGLVYRGIAVPADGCSGESRRRLGQGAPPVADPRLGDRLSYQSLGQTEADPRVRAVFGQWSSCMRRAGFDYPSPAAAMNSPAFESPTATRQEKAVASADVRCKRETNLIAVRVSVEIAHQKAMYEQNAEALEAVRTYWTKQARNAEAIFAQP